MYQNRASRNQEMFKKIWQSFMRWVRKTFGNRSGKSTLGAIQSPHDRVAKADLPPLDDTDREYLFMQLLEGVAHGWQQPRAIGFFNKIRQRVRKSEWLEWLDRFGNNLLNAPVPNYELAGRMVQLGQLDCGEIGDLAGEYGVRLLNRQTPESIDGFQPILEFNSPDWSDREAEFDEVPPELLIDRDPIRSPSPRSFQPQAEEDAANETREITLEEFAAMLNQDPNLVAELAEQFGIETTDPQVIINAVIAQMQQQVQISGDLHHPPSTETPPEVETPSNLTPPPPTLDPPAPPRQIAPPPPPPKLEYGSDDPWSNNSNASTEIPETVNTPDRGV
jgi:hypothetical protein